MNHQKLAIQKINTHGMLLVFPILNARDPRSLWYEFHPRTKMRWEWNENGDDKVGEMWALMKKLSSNKQVVYSKWYQGRATFFSRELFTAMLGLLLNAGDIKAGLSRPAKNLLDILESDSPLSTKQLKKMAQLQGKDNEAIYNRALKDLFAKQLIIAFGEVDDGAFPSLAVGATRLLFEDLWSDAKRISTTDAQHTVHKYLPDKSKRRLYFDKTLNKISI